MRKFKSREVNIVDPNKVVFIVGETPGKPKKDPSDNLCWNGGRSGSLIKNLTKDCKNLLLTNSYNYYCETKEEREWAKRRGKLDLLGLVYQYKPIKIIALGEYAAGVIEELKFDILTVKLRHPSYILRFNKDVERYGLKLLEEIATID